MAMSKATVAARELERLDAEAPAGKWTAKVWRHAGQADTVCVKNADDSEIINWMGFDGNSVTKAEARATARFVAALVNAYRAGFLISPASDDNQ
ncbi:hypothetical protein ACSMXM_01210 [Pacificimonas sp. ICDLI1SI03]